MEQFVMDDELHVEKLENSGLEESADVDKFAAALGNIDETAGVLKVTKADDALDELQILDYDGGEALLDADDDSDSDSDGDVHVVGYLAMLRMMTMPMSAMPCLAVPVEVMPVEVNVNEDLTLNDTRALVTKDSAPSDDDELAR